MNGCQLLLVILHLHTLTDNQDIPFTRLSLVCLQHQFAVCNDNQRAVYCMVSSGWGVWVSLQSSAVVRLFHATTYESLCNVDVTQTVQKMLAGKVYFEKFGACSILCLVQNISLKGRSNPNLVWRH